MPQLDSNTFIYQYVGIITLLLGIYIILSYIVLPLILRFSLIRNSFLLSKQVSSDLTTNFITTSQLIINLRTPVTLAAQVLNIFLTKLVFIENNFTKLLNIKLSKTNTVLASNNTRLGTFNLVESVNDYLILYLAIEDEEINND